MQPSAQPRNLPCPNTNSSPASKAHPMAVNALNGSPVYKLPDELLLHIAEQLDPAKPKELTDLLNLCLTSKQLSPIAQEALHRTVKPRSSCACHPKVNGILRLLRTLLARPDLASKVKALDFQVVRKNVAKVCEEQNFSIEGLRNKSLAKLKETGYQKGHPWWTSIENSIESSFGGLLLTLLPKLVKLEFMVSDHRRGWHSLEPISALFGVSSPPDAVAPTLRNVEHITVSDIELFKYTIDFANLSRLNLKGSRFGSMLRLNGPNSLYGATNLKALTLDTSIQFAERDHVEKFEIQLCDLFTALGCEKLTQLTLTLINDGYSPTDEDGTVFDISYLMKQLDYFSSSLEELYINFDPNLDPDEIDWIWEHLKYPVKSLKKFSSLLHLSIPTRFLFVDWPDEDKCPPSEIPATVKHLEFLYPDPDVIDWVQDLADISTGNTKTVVPKLEIITLKCHHEVNAPPEYFMEPVDSVWPILYDVRKIEGFVCCSDHGGYKMSLQEMYRAEKEEESSGENHWFSEDEDDPNVPGMCVKCGRRCGRSHYYTEDMDEDRSDDSDLSDEDMPSLENPDDSDMPSLEEPDADMSGLDPLIDEMD